MTIFNTGDNVYENVHITTHWKLRVIAAFATFKPHILCEIRAINSIRHYCEIMPGITKLLLKFSTSHNLQINFANSLFFSSVTITVLIRFSVSNFLVFFSVVDSTGVFLYRYPTPLFVTKELYVSSNRTLFTIASDTELDLGGTIYCYHLPIA